MEKRHALRILQLVGMATVCVRSTIHCGEDVKPGRMNKAKDGIISKSYTMMCREVVEMEPSLP